MNVLVTGGCGCIGRYVVADLVRGGHAVTSVDVRGPAPPGCRGVSANLTDAGQVYPAVAGAEAVVHMGAWSSAGQAPDPRTYGDNVQATFNVLQACADMGVRRIVSASSNQVYGLAGAPPLYVPVDENHPLRPVNCYALSKMAGEQAAAYFVARYGLEIASFRILGTRTPAELPAEIERVAADPAAGAGVLWTRADARDVALACRLALEADELKPGPYNITGAEVVLDQDSAALVERFCGAATEIRSGLEGRLSPLSCARAEEAFGYRPRYVWSVGRHHPEAD